MAVTKEIRDIDYTFFIPLNDNLDIDFNQI